MNSAIVRFGKHGGGRSEQAFGFKANLLSGHCCNLPVDFTIEDCISRMFFFTACVDRNKE